MRQSQRREIKSLKLSAENPAPVSSQLPSACCAPRSAAGDSEQGRKARCREELSGPSSQALEGKAKKMARAALAQDGSGWWSRKPVFAVRSDEATGDTSVATGKMPGYRSC